MTDKSYATGYPGDLNVFRGDWIDTAEMVDRMADLAERTITYHIGINRQGSLEALRGTRTGRGRPDLLPKGLMRAISPTMVSPRLLSVITHEAHYVAGVEGQSNRTLGGAALLQPGTFLDVNGNRMLEEPQVNVLAFGMEHTRGSVSIDGYILHALADKILEYARQLSDVMYQVTGRFGAKPFTPTVNFMTEMYALPTAPAERLSSDLHDFTEALKIVKFSTPRTQTDFATHIAAVHNSFQALKTLHGNHPIVRSIAESEVMNAADLLGAVDSDYQIAQRVSVAVMRLLNAIKEETVRQGTILHPATFETDQHVTFETDLENDNGAFMMMAKVDEKAVGSIEFSPNGDGTVPKVRINGHFESRPGLYSDCCGAIVEHALKGNWWLGQVRG